MKTFKKILSALCIMTMIISVFSLMSVPASAASDVTFTVPTVTKNRTSDGAAMPTETYTFKLEPADNLDAKDVAVNGVTPQIGPALSSVTGNTVTYAANESGSKTCSPIGTTNFGDAPGIFKYQLTEVGGNVAGESYDTATKYYVYVVYGYATPTATSLSVLGCYAYKAGTDYTLGQAHSSSGNGVYNKVNPEFNNTFGTTTLKFSKEVTGTFGDRTKLFTFHLQTTASAGFANGDTITTTGSTFGSPAGHVLTVGTEYTIQLKHGETFSISGLPVGLQYTVSEDSESNYTTTATAVSGNAASASNASGRTGTMSGTIQDGDNELKYVNSTGENTPTGVFLDYMPYLIIGGCAIVAMATFIVLRKKKKVTNIDEDDD